MNTRVNKRSEANTTTPLSPPVHTLKNEIYDFSTFQQGVKMYYDFPKF